MKKRIIWNQSVSSKGWEFHLLGFNLGMSSFGAALIAVPLAIIQHMILSIHHYRHSAALASFRAIDQYGD